MLIGQTARKILGKNGFRKVGGLYRRIFFNLENFARTMPAIEPGSVILDIGSGDGEPMNYLLRRYPNTKVIMTDVGHNIGTFLDDEVKGKVELHPGTSIKDLLKSKTVKPDYILIMDVLHHIPREARAEFLQELKELIGDRSCKIIVKDNQPGHLRTTLGYLSDVYVSGDKNTHLVSKEYLLDMMRSVFGDIPYYETDLFKVDKPNYSFVFSVQGS
jgi:2-polyprenyl-3-methyl-5-hydroxy-6-metoxy-1,4-benzoquinol methylase